MLDQPEQRPRDRVEGRFGRMSGQQGCDVSLGLEEVDGRLRQSLEIRKFLVSYGPSLASHIGSLFKAWLGKGLLLFIIFYPDCKGKGPTLNHNTRLGWKGQKEVH